MQTDDLWPRTREYRFRLYGRKGRALDVLAAAPTWGGIGTAIGQLDQDCVEAGVEFGDHGQIGVLDVIERRWIVRPWNRSRQVDKTEPDMLE